MINIVSWLNHINQFFYLVVQCFISRSCWCVVIVTLLWKPGEDLQWKCSQLFRSRIYVFPNHDLNPTRNPLPDPTLKEKNLLLVTGCIGERRPKSQLLFWPRIGSLNALMAYSLLILLSFQSKFQSLMLTCYFVGLEQRSWSNISKSPLFMILYICIILPIIYGTDLEQSCYWSLKIDM